MVIIAFQVSVNTRKCVVNFKIPIFINGLHRVVIVSVTKNDGYPSPEAVVEEHLLHVTIKQSIVCIGFDACRDLPYHLPRPR